MKTLMFDLDGTLLPMKQDEFASCYFRELMKLFKRAGYDSSRLVEAMWAGVRQMVINPGPYSNEEAFWKCFGQFYPELEREKLEELFMGFYATQFNECITATQPTETAPRIIKKAREKGYRLILATNPIFPPIATCGRIRWGGMDPGDFIHITTYDNTVAGKPNLDYYRRLIEQFSLTPEDTIMIGNDAEEDLVIRQLGFKTFLVTDCLENKKNLPLETEWQGSLAELLSFMENLPEAKVI